MASAEKPRRVTIGFEGGTSLSARLSVEALKKLNEALGTDGWHDLVAEDGDVRLNLAQVQFVRTDSSDKTVGF